MKTPFRRTDMPCLLLVMALMAAAPDLKAGDIETAKDHFEKGKLLVEEGAYAKAVVELKKSYELNALPIVLYNIAVCYDTLQRYALALQYYTYYMERDKNMDEVRRLEVVERIEKLGKFIGHLELEVAQEDAEVIVDGNLMGHTPIDSIPIETGEHVLTLRKVGYHDVSKTFTIVSKETARIKVTMSRAYAAVSAKQLEARAVESAAEEGEKEARPVKYRQLKPAAFWTAAGITLAATVGLIVTGSLAVEKNSEVSAMTDENDDWKAARDEGRKLATAADVMLGAAVLGGVTSLFLFLFTDFEKKKEKPSGLSAGLLDGGALLQYKGRF